MRHTCAGPRGLANPGRAKISEHRAVANQQEVFRFNVTVRDAGLRERVDGEGGAPDVRGRFAIIQYGPGQYVVQQVATCEGHRHRDARALDLNV